MTDLVESLRLFTQELTWEFYYGNKVNQNLLQGMTKEGRVITRAEKMKGAQLVDEECQEVEEYTNRIYFLLDPITRNKSFSEFGGTGAVTFTGAFLLATESTLDKTYDGSDGKYKTKILPILKTQLTKLEDKINCSAYEIKNWEVVDAIDVLDINFDGVLVTFNLQILEG